jgi:hypothetical protein
MTDQTHDERTIGADRIRAEHLAAVHVAAQWAYLVGLLVLGSVAMLLLIAILDAA